MTGQPFSVEAAVPLAATPPDCPSVPVPPLLRLPLELHHLIAARLSLPGYLALRLTHPYLYNALAAPAPTPSLRTLDSCARLAVRAYLASFFSGCNGRSNDTIAETEQKKTTKDAYTWADQGKARLQKDTPRHCLLCATPYAPRLFKSTSSPAVDAADHGVPITTYPSLSSTPGASRPHLSPSLPNSCASSAGERGRRVLSRSNPAWDVLPLPDGVCAWHVSRFARVVHEWPATLPYPAAALGNSRNADGGLDTDGPGENGSDPPQQWCWYAFTSALCSHCGAVGAFKTCTCTRAPTSKPLASASSAVSPRAAPDGCSHTINHDAAAPEQRQRGDVAKSATTATTGNAGAPTPAMDNNTSSHCKTCSIRPVTVYVRYLPNDNNATRQRSWDVSSFRFWRDADDRLWVREQGFVSSTAGEGGGASSWDWGRSRVLDAWSWGAAMGWSGQRGWGGSGRETEMERQRRRGSRRDGEMRVVDVPVRWIDM